VQIEANDEHTEALSQRNIPFEITLLAAEDDVATVYFKNSDPNTSSGNSVFKENNPSDHVRDSFHAVHLRSQTIDRVVARHGLGQVDFLKMDLQGSELQALRGAEFTLRGVEVVQAEFHVVNFNEGAPSLLEVYSFLDSAGFALYDVGEVQRFLVSTEIGEQEERERVTKSKTLGVDLVFVKKGSRLWEKSCTLFPKPLHLSAT
jgi:FkbM family methyltransferase